MLILRLAACLTISVVEASGHVVTADHTEEMIWQGNLPAGTQLVCSARLQVQ